MKPRLCVRCGKEPRAEDLFVGPACADDPAKVAEVRDAEAATKFLVTTDGERGRAQRAYVVQTHHWHGHWSHRE